jgi:hypothetical protein
VKETGADREGAVPPRAHASIRGGGSPRPGSDPRPVVAPPVAGGAGGQPPPTPGGALRRSLLAWGWGHLAAGDRRGWALPPVQVALVVGLAWVGPQLAQGTGVGLLFLLGALLFTAWGAVALHAARVAGRRRVALGLAPGGATGLSLLWLAPVAILLSSAFWGLAGRAAEPATALDWYVDAWQQGRAGDAGAYLATPLPPAELLDAWQRQEAALRTELVLLAAQAGAAAGIEPATPFATIRWVDAGPTGEGGRRIAIEVARRETERGALFGFLPTSSLRLVTMATLGHVVLARTPIPGPLPSGPWAEAWRIVTIEVAGVPLAAPAVDPEP